MFTFYDAWCFVLFAVVIMIVYCFAGVEAASYRDDDEDGDEDNDVDEEEEDGNDDEDVDNYDDVDNDDIDDDDDGGGGFDRCLGEGGCWRGDCVSTSH